MTDSFTVTGYSDGDVDTNDTTVRSLESLADERYSRRQTLFGGMGATGMALFGTTMLSACGGDELNQSPIITPGSVAATSAGRVVTLTTSVAADVLAGTWTQTGGEAVTLTTVDATTATFIAPSVAQPSDLTFAYSAPTQRGGNATGSSTVRVNPAVLGFAAVPKNLNDVATVPAGYSVTVLTRLGDPIATGVSAYANNGTDTDFDKRIGDHGDALHFFGLSAAGARDDNSNTRGLMVQNHENLSIQYLHPNGPTNVTRGPRPQGEALKEMMAHGVSVSEYVDAGNRKWSYVPTSTFNRRLTPATVMQFNGPGAGSAMLSTLYSPDGTRGRGTINNCANGITPWATNLTCEENWAGYFRRDATGAGADTAKRSAREQTALSRYGVTSNTGNYAWSSVATTDTLYTRWDARAKADSAAQDFRNEPNHFGWVVEFDPYDPASTPRKRTALGRSGHEGAFVQAVPGKKLAVYMGDDSRREYLYKFVSNTIFAAADGNSANRLAMGDKYLDAGVLYVAKFNADGSGQWLPLVFGQVPARPASASTPAYTFADQADVLINCRLAADAVGATPMDRPEWTAGNPVTGEIYLTLTNNNAAGRPLNGTDAANPRHYNDPKGSTAPVTDPATPPQPTAQYGNPNGHIIRLRESGDDAGAATFRWDIYLFAADSADADPVNVNVSGLTADNDLSSPDGLYFSRATSPLGKVKPVLWIQTDDGAMTDRTNCMMLAAMPGSVGDGGAKTITNKDATGATASQATIVGAPATAATLRRFLVGPKQCEITGIDMTPDGRTLFVGIQHPGEEGTPAAPSSHWPDSQSSATVAATVRPRSAIIAITKDDGGTIAL
jgi:secreted PhoX family phosphatase